MLCFVWLVHYSVFTVRRRIAERSRLSRKRIKHFTRPGILQDLAFYKAMAVMAFYKT